MRNRSVFLVLLFSILTVGIYSLYWLVSTKDEMNRLGANIPSAWLLIVPIANVYWLWRFCEGVGQATRNEMTGPVAFLMLFLLSYIGMMVVQASFNQVPDHRPIELPAARIV